MRGDPKVIEQLNAALRLELTFIVQYMVQAEMCDSWGYHRLAGLTKARAIEEMHHAERFIERIIFLDGPPTIDIPLVPKVGAAVEQQLEIDFTDEADAVRQYNNASTVCREVGDAGSKDLFESILQDEERHVDFFETQIHVIKDMGLGPYLSQQLQA